MDKLQLTVNGEQVEADDAGPHTTLLNWLRGRGLTAAKEGCAEGECGACAVLVLRPAPDSGSRLESLNSCLVTMGTLHGAEVLTAEGLGDVDALHPAQHVMSQGGASQCGYCTPGIVSSMAGEYYRPGRCAGDHGCASGVDLHALAGNLCRCTGYRPIKEAAEALAFPSEDDPWAARLREPAQLGQPVTVTSPYGEFHRPATLAEALDLLGRDGAQALAGGTDLNVEVNLRGSRPAVLVAVDALPELRGFSVDADRIELGAGLSLAQLETRLDGRVPLLSALFPQFASPLIRHAATLGGNLGTASPIGDSPPCLLALDASVVLVGRDGEREVALADFFTGYRQTLRAPGELIKSVRIPLPMADTVAFHKIAKRRLDDISSVAVAYALRIEDGVVRSARIGLGGVAATPLRAYATEAALVDRPWNAETIEAAASVLGGEGTPMSDARASAAYRSAMLASSLRRLFAEGMVSA